MLPSLFNMYSPESIAFQSTAFHEALIDIIDQYRNKPSDAERTDLELELAKCIKKYTGINTEINIGPYQMSVELPQLDMNSPMLEGYGYQSVALSKRSISDIRKNPNGKLVGMIDPSSSFVSGYFAEMAPVRIFLNSWMIYQAKKENGLSDGKSYTSAEISAPLLHEVGHIWTFLYFLVRFRTDNLMLGVMGRELAGTVDYAKREIIITEVANAMKLEEVDAQALSHKGNNTVHTVMIANVARRNRSTIGGGYDINSFEAMADQFASRHGASRDLVTCLDKLSKGSIYRRGATSYAFFEFAKVAMVMTGVLVPGLIGVTMLGVLVMLADSHNDWYNKTGQRFIRIRQDLIEQLKDPNVSKVDSLRIRQSIDAIDEVNTRYKDYTQLTGLIYDYLIPSGITKRKDIEFQQGLEEMAKNRLFYFANELKNA